MAWVVVDSSRSKKSEGRWIDNQRELDLTQGDRSPMSLLSVMVGMELASGVIGIGGRLYKKENGH